MRVAVLHDHVPEVGATPDQRDVLVQADAVSAALRELGHEPFALSTTLDLSSLRERLETLQPSLVFNLVESVEGRGSLIFLPAALLDLIGIPYTGCGTEPLFLTTNKVAAKKLLLGGSIPTPPGYAEEDLRGGPPFGPTTFILKSVWEHASIGLEEDSVMTTGSAEHLLARIEERRKTLGVAFFAETYIEGREFNLSLLASSRGPEVLPPAEIRFEGFPETRRKIVGYRAKWVEDSFEYTHTPRTFRFPQSDGPLLLSLADLAKRCWTLFRLRGYARVDFRVDGEGRPWVLEVNTNPCLSPDAGFAAASREAGLAFPEVIRRIVADAPAGERDLSRGPRRAGERAHPEQEDELRFRSEPRPTDPEMVRRMVAYSGFFSAAEVEIALELVNERIGKGEASGYFFSFAERGGETVGYSCFGPVPGTVGSWDLYWIAVMPDLRGAGLGKRIIRQVEAEIRRMGGRRVYVETSSRETYHPTRAFYRRCGYREEATLEDFYSQGDGKIIFLKVLSP